MKITIDQGRLQKEAEILRMLDSLDDQIRVNASLWQLNFWANPDQSIVLALPRRSGKTYALAVDVALYAVMNPGHTQTLVSAYPSGHSGMLSHLVSLLGDFEALRPGVYSFTQGIIVFRSLNKGPYLASTRVLADDVVLDNNDQSLCTRVLYTPQEGN